MTFDEKKNLPYMGVLLNWKYKKKKLPFLSLDGHRTIIKHAVLLFSNCCCTPDE
jgi:hypothetical protein